VRIVSLLPSATEIVCALGLQDSLVGVTHECDHPPAVARLPRVTRTLIPHDAASSEIDALVREQLRTQQALYTLDRPVLEALAPDLLVTQALCDVCAVADAEVRAVACALPGQPRVLNLEPTCLDDVFACLQLVADAAGVPERGRETIAALRARVDAVARRASLLSARPTVGVLEWIDPPFSSGHWTPELIALAGGRPLLGTAGERSRTLAWDDVRAADPEVLVIACCGFDVARTWRDLPILAAQPGFEALAAVRAGRVYLTDGNAYFSRPGPRLVDSLEILAHAIAPDVHPLPTGLPAAERALVAPAPAGLTASVSSASRSR
jgi:iron complex transport system substrate-binding protein